MAREKITAVNPFLRELLNHGVYKRTQGRIARQVTFAALAVLLALGAWRLSDTLTTVSSTLKLMLPLTLALIGWWVAFRVVNMPRFADFLIAVEAEMNKVSWPSRGELIRSSIVVLITIFALTIVLFGYDFAWGFLLRFLGIVGAAGGGA
jgi:preprotein translocase subunit SecE